MKRLTDVAHDYLSMGIPTVWLLDPIGKKAYAADTAEGFHEEMGQISTAEGRVAFSLAEIFSEEDLF